MAISRTYLDYNASAPLLNCAREAMIDVLNQTSHAGVNASSVHFEGRNAHKLIDKARTQLGQSIGVNGNQIVFTSGASEAASHALSPIIRAGGRKVEVSKLYVAATEHPCILSGGRFDKQDIVILPVLESGMLDLNALEKTLAAHDSSSGAPMVAVMLANNETGIIQPIAQISDIVLRYDGFLTVDAVQALGKTKFDVASLGAHFVILSSHKIGGPHGAGALIFGDASISPQPMIGGGGQENFQRAGTENVAAIAGFGAAIDYIMQNNIGQIDIATIRDSIEYGISTICKDAGNKAGVPVFFANNENRLPNTTCFAIPGIKADMALISLDLAGFAVSSGSACSSGKVKKSHVLASMGVSDELANCALRISAGYETSLEDAKRFLGEMKNIVNRVG